MSEYAVMPLSDYTDMCDTIREKSGTEDGIKSGELAERIDGVYNAGQIAILERSNYMRGAASGVAISINDAALVKQEINIFLTKPSGNLIELPYLFTTYEEDGDIYTVNSDGSISIYNGNRHGTSVTILENITLEAGTYTFSGGVLNSEVGLNIRSGALLEESLWIFGDNAVTFTLEETATDVKIYISSDSNLSYGKTVTIKPRLNTGETVTTDEVADLSAVLVSRYGKNIANLDTGLKESSNQSLSKTDNSNYRLTRVSTSKGVYGGWCDCFIPKGTEFTVGFNILEETLTNTRIFIQWGKQDKTEITYTPISISSPYKAVVLAEDIYYFRLYMLVAETEGNYIEFNNFQIELGNVGTEFESYIEPQRAKANADGTVNGITTSSQNITLFADTENVIINCMYLRDIDKYIDNLITNVALTGGE